LLLVTAVGVAFVGAAFRPHCWTATITVLAAAAVLLTIAIRRPPAPAEPTPRLRRGVLLWAAVLAAGLAWEAYAFVRQDDWSRADPDNPTISTLFDPVLEQGPLRVVGWLVWLAAGWRLVRRP
jgi:hypothetical protein